MGQEFGAVASGSWETIKSKKKKTIASWTDDLTSESLLFEFKKNGRIKIFSDQNGNQKINRRKDILIGQDKFRNAYDGRYYDRNHFMLMGNGFFEIEVEGYIDDNDEYQAYYSIRLDSGIDIETEFGFATDINKFVDVKDHGLLTSLFQPDI